MKELAQIESHRANPDGLASLHLSASDMQPLARQGFVSREYRQHRGPYYKLRWRADGM